MLSEKKVQALWIEAELRAHDKGQTVAMYFARLVEAAALEQAVRPLAKIRAMSASTGIIYGHDEVDELRSRARAARRAANMERP